VGLTGIDQICTVADESKEALQMLSENWLEEMLLNDESAAAAIPELQQPTQEELVIREMVLLGEITEEEAQAMLHQNRIN
jgi:polyhydroxyalkanoate synthesis regulator phasin